MHPSTYAALVLGVILLIAGVYDYLAVIHWGYDGTLTYVLRGWIRKYPLLPFAAGALVMHLLEGGQ